MTNSKRMAVHLLIMTIALGALTIHLVSAEDESSSAAAETATALTGEGITAALDSTGQTSAADGGSAVTIAPGSTGDHSTAASSDTSGGASQSVTGPKADVTTEPSTGTGQSIDQTGVTQAPGIDGADQGKVAGTAPQPQPSLAPDSTDATEKIGKVTEGKKESGAGGAAPLVDDQQQCKCDHVPTVWEAHTALFLVIIIIGACCVALTSACCICMICYGRSPMDDDTCDCFGPRQHKLHPEKGQILMEQGTAEPHPIEVPNPIPDAEIIKDEAPMLERENPAVTPNGGGQHISKNEDDNGWVVPLDELSSAEKEKPEVENTRL